MSAYRRWRDDELVVLLAFYFRYARAAHTDSHRDCQQLACALGRSPGAVDNQLRNVDFDLMRQTADRHCSERLAELLDRHRHNLRTLYHDANQILRLNGWDFPTF